MGISPGISMGISPGIPHLGDIPTYPLLIPGRGYPRGYPLRGFLPTLVNYIK